MLSTPDNRGAEAATGKADRTTTNGPGNLQGNLTAGKWNRASAKSNRMLAELFLTAGEWKLTLAEGIGSISKWSGKSARVSPGRRPRTTTFEGTWDKVKGIGRYEDVNGRGMYEGRFTLRPATRSIGRASSPRPAGREVNFWSQGVSHDNPEPTFQPTHEAWPSG